jgi:competence ComEA-like helix-hairpin-helix protein
MLCMYYYFSRTSSKVPSLESIPSSTAESSRMAGSSSSRFAKMININNATMFDLMSVEGINQATAARIINYRENKGPFKCLDDLRRTGISRKRLSVIKMYLTTEECDSDLSSTVSSNSPVRTPRRPDGKGETRRIQFYDSNDGYSM